MKPLNTSLHYKSVQYKVKGTVCMISAPSVLNHGLCCQLRSRRRPRQCSNHRVTQRLSDFHERRQRKEREKQHRDVFSILLFAFRLHSQLLIVSVSAAQSEDGVLGGPRRFGLTGVPVRGRPHSLTSKNHRFHQQRKHLT